jgi:hypothetical protein
MQLPPEYPLHPHPVLPLPLRVDGLVDILGGQEPTRALFGIRFWTRLMGEFP